MILLKPLKNNMKKKGKIKTEKQEKKDSEWVQGNTAPNHNEIKFAWQVNPKNLVVSRPKK